MFQGGQSTDQGQQNERPLGAASQPPRNAAEHAIATFKKHFIAGLATVDKNCPLQLWDEFLPLIKLTFNLLCFP